MAEKETENEGEKAVAAPAKSKKKLFLIIGGVVVLLLAIGIPLAFMGKKGGDKELENGELDPEAAAKEGAKAVMVEGHDDEEELVEGEEPLGAIFPLDTFVVNLKGGKYIRLQIQLEFVGRDIPSRFYSRNVLVRDAILTLLSVKSQEDLAEAKDKEQLRTEIKNLINEILKKEEIKKVYYSQFLVQ